MNIANYKLFIDATYMNKARIGQCRIAKGKIKRMWSCAPKRVQNYSYESVHDRESGQWFAFIDWLPRTIHFNMKKKKKIKSKRKKNNNFVLYFITVCKNTR